MSDRHDVHEEDARLRRLFARMRQEDRDAVPPFPALEEAPPRRRWQWLPAAAATAAVALAVLVWMPGGDPEVEHGTLLAEWTAPSTEFLGLDEVGVDFAVVVGDAAGTYDEWMDFPTDTLIEQADEIFGQESRQ